MKARMDDLLTPVCAGHGTLVLPVPTAVRGRWCRVEIHGTPDGRAHIMRLRIQLAGRDVGRLETYAASRLDGRSRGALIALPVDTVALHIDVFGLAPGAPRPTARLRPITRGAAATQLLTQSWRQLPALIRSLPGGPVQRLRALLTILSQQRPRWLDYALWRETFDTWSDRDRDALLAARDRAAWPTIGLLLDRRDAAPAAIAATEGALQAQWLHAPVTSLPPDSAGMLGDLLDRRGEDYIGILRAGEVLPPQTLALFAEQAAAGAPDALYADEDRIGAAGERRDPQFKPAPGAAFLVSGLLTGGLWLFRRDRLEALRHISCGSADQLRLEAALALVAAPNPPQIRHLPFVLSHRRFDTLAPPSQDLGEIVRCHLAAASLPAVVDATGFPLRVRMRWADPDTATAPPKVSFIVPSAARAAHVGDCLARILQQTDYPNFEMIVVVSQSAPLDAEQEAVLAPLRAGGKLRVEMLPAARFNFSRATNVGVAACDGPLICLLNDDVAPIDADWLSILVGHLNAPDVAAVGAKLLYPDHSVQHGGVIAGLAGACEHAHRGLPGDAPGYMHRAVVDQEMSCVTGACLLMRRADYEALGGLDETWEVSFNDVDLCLRLRERGRRVIFAASARLLHYEGASLGHHYMGDREGLGEIEIDRFRARWHEVCAADPFHNPNLSLQRAHEWDPAFPPRVERPGAGDHSPHPGACRVSESVRSPSGARADAGVPGDE
jgi:GT2 family glycosyltransferase